MSQKNRPSKLLPNFCEIKSKKIFAAVTSCKKWSRHQTIHFQSFQGWYVQTILMVSRLFLAHARFFKSGLTVFFYIVNFVRHPLCKSSWHRSLNFLYSQNVSVERQRSVCWDRPKNIRKRKYKTFFARFKNARKIFSNNSRYIKCQLSFADFLLLCFFDFGRIFLLGLRKISHAQRGQNSYYQKSTAT